jgi:hypothetical protein
MGLKYNNCLQTLVLTVVAVAQGQTIDSSTNVANNDAVATIENSVSPTPGPDEDCDIWLALLVSSDVDSSYGISESEFHSFLSSIADPPYVAGYFEGIPSFSELPWVFKVVHKSLACQCKTLGMWEGCCEGDDAEIILLGLEDGVMNGNTVTNDAAQEEYRALVCQQIAYVLTKSIPILITKSPVDGSTISPSHQAMPNPAPTAMSPSTASSNPSRTVKAPSTMAPSTVKSNPSSSTAAPSASALSTVVTSEGNGGAKSDGAIAGIESYVDNADVSGAGIGAIIGIIFSILLCCLVCIVARDRSRKVEGGRVPAVLLDAEAPPAAVEERGPRPKPSSEWSESDADVEEVCDLVDVENKTRYSSVSALAAMGAASIVTANLIAPRHNSVR